MTIRSSEMEARPCDFANGLLLTRAGQVVFASAREILASKAGLLDSLDGLVSNKRLVLACTSTFGMAYLPQVFNIFRTTYPCRSDRPQFYFSATTEGLAPLA